MDSAPSPPSLPQAVTYRHSGLGLALALLGILVCVLCEMRLHTVQQTQQAERAKPNPALEMLARYWVGVKASIGSWDAQTTQTVLNSMQEHQRDDNDALRLLIVRGWMSDTWPAEADLESVAGNSEALKQDVEALRQLKSSQGSLDEVIWKQLHQRHNWIADLARAQASEEHDIGGERISTQARKAIEQQGMAMMISSFVILLLVVVGAAVGLVLMILGIMRWNSGKLKLTLARSSREDGGVLVEGFALYLAISLTLHWLLHFMSLELPRWTCYGPQLVGLLVGMTWPLLRGMHRPMWSETLGLHWGQGLLREMGAGVLGWLAALPLLVLGIISVLLIVRLTGHFPSHPINDKFLGGGSAKLEAIVLLVVWAPISEEVMFRGMLFPGLSARLRWLLGMVAGAFVFAVLHPQGWACVPVIMLLAGMFSLLRMWRRSLIAPMMAHALNNGIISTVAMMAF